MNKWPRIILISMVFILAFSSVAFWGYKRIKEGRKISDKNFQEIVKSPEELAKSDIEVRAELAFVRDVHEMANTKITAEDNEKWGNISITSEKCNAMIVEAMKSNYKNKEEYLKILERWRNEDYSNSVDDHNFVWNLLGGTIGKAKGLLNP